MSTPAQTSTLDPLAVLRGLASLRRLAGSYPAGHPMIAQKLRELVDRWWAEAGAFDVLPLDDREYERVAANAEARARSRYVYYPGMARIDRLSAPYITDRSWNLSAEVEIPAGGAEGVLLAAGSRFAGYVLYVKDGHPVFEYVYSPAQRQVIRSETAAPAGPSELRYEFRRTSSAAASRAKRYPCAPKPLI